MRGRWSRRSCLEAGRTGLVAPGEPPTGVPESLGAGRRQRASEIQRRSSAVIGLLRASRRNANVLANVLLTDSSQRACVPGSQRGGCHHISGRSFFGRCC
jgi:hypothetical protein